MTFAELRLYFRGEDTDDGVEVLPEGIIVVDGLGETLDSLKRREGRGGRNEKR